jgi:hypothetical protein
METSESNWEMLKAKSAYHFDNWKTDARWDCVQGIGRFLGNWEYELAEVIKSAQPVTWRTRSEDGKPNKHINKEEYDLSAAGADPNMTIANFEYKLEPVFREMCDKIGLTNRFDRIHVQWPGQVFTKHIDKLQKVNPEDPSKVMRIMVQLTDWDQGHFAQYGNYTYSHWRAGDIHTFDWKNVPHSSANAGLTPRVSLLTTGVVTDKTLRFLEEAKNTYEIPVIEYQAWMEYGLLDK